MEFIWGSLVSKGPSLNGSASTFRPGPNHNLGHAIALTNSEATPDLAERDICSTHANALVRPMVHARPGAKGHFVAALLSTVWSGRSFG